MGYPLDRWKPWAPFPSEEVMLRNAVFLATQHGWEVELETGEVLKKGEAVMLLKKNKPLKKTELQPRMMGSRDPDVPGMVLVPIAREHKLLPLVKSAPGDTFYRFDPKKNRVECMVTMMPGGLNVAWDTCGQCALHIRACTCRAIVPSRSVVRIWEIASGEEFVKSSYERPTPTFIPKPRKPLAQRPLLAKAKPLSTPEPVKKPLLAKKPVTLDKNTSLSQFDNAAEKSAGDSIAKLMKSVQASKPLLKKAR